MRKWRFTRQVSGKGTTFLAFFIAAAVHAVFLLPEYRTSNTELDRKAHGVQMLNMAELSPEKFQSLKNWIKIHDPAGVSRSSSASGYTALLPPAKKFTVSVDPFKEKMLRTLPAMRRFTGVSVFSLPKAAVPEPESRSAGKTGPAEAAVFDHKGNKAALPLVLPAGAGSIKPTVITLRKAGKVFITSLTASSGDPALDRAAVTASLKWDPAEETTLTFVWPAEVKK